MMLSSEDYTPGVVQLSPNDIAQPLIDAVVAALGREKVDKENIAIVVRFLQGEIPYASKKPADLTPEEIIIQRYLIANMHLHVFMGEKAFADLTHALVKSTVSSHGKTNMAWVFADAVMQAKPRSKNPYNTKTLAVTTMESVLQIPYLPDLSLNEDTVQKNRVAFRAFVLSLPSFDKSIRTAEDEEKLTAVLNSFYGASEEYNRLNYLRVVVKNFLEMVEDKKPSQWSRLFGNKKEQILVAETNRALHELRQLYDGIHLSAKTRMQIKAEKERDPTTKSQVGDRNIEAMKLLKPAVLHLYQKIQAAKDKKMLAFMREQFPFLPKQSATAKKKPISPLHRKR